VSIQRINYGRGGHGYKVDGHKVDGVTTLINEGLPKPALTRWAAKAVAEHVADNLDAVLGMRDMGRDAIVAALKEAPWTSLNRAAVRGTEVHALAEQLVHGTEVEVPEPLSGHVESYVRFLDEWKVKPVIVEAVVASRKWRYAGTTDGVVYVRGNIDPVIIDIKTSVSGIFPEVAYQLAAYRYAEVYLDGKSEKPMADLGIGGGYAIWVRGDGYDVVPVDCNDRVFKDFLHIAWTARAARTNKELVGEAVQV
jgi:hypothetical protein